MSVGINVPSLTTTFDALTDDAKQAVEGLYEVFKPLHEREAKLSGRAKNDLAYVVMHDLIDELSIEDKALLAKDQLLPIVEVVKQKDVFARLLGSYTQELANINPAIFPFLAEKEVEACRRQLLYAFFLIYAQRQIDIAAQNGKTLKDHNDNMARCLQLLDKLANFENKDGREKVKVNLDDALIHSDQSVKYIGLTAIGPWLAKEVKGVADNQMTVEKIITGMSKVNEKRLYWVWGGSMLGCILDMLSKSFFNTMQAQQGVAAPAPYTGTMSYTLYYTRFGFELSLFLLNTIKGPWMSEEQKKLSYGELFRTQWNQRKFALINDSVWATANLLCFFWLTGPGMMGYAGNLVTVGLLVMDIILTVWRFWEESTKHNATMEAFKADRKTLNDELQALQVSLAQLKRENAEKELPTFDEEKKALEEKIADKEAELIRHTKRQHGVEVDWKFRKYGLINDLTYAVGLMLAFSVMCCLFFPPASIAPATVLIISLVGAALCFVLTVAYAAINNGLQIAKSKQLGKEALVEGEALLDRFLKLGSSEADEKLKRQLYLEMKGLKAESDHQNKMVKYQIIELVRSIFIDACFPALIFASLVFLPLGIGIAVIAAGIAIGGLSNLLVKQFVPEKAAQVEFDEKEFDTFELAVKEVQAQGKKPSLALLDTATQATTKKGYDPRFLGKAAKEGTSDSDEEGYDNPPSVEFEPLLGTPIAK